MGPVGFMPGGLRGGSRLGQEAGWLALWLLGPAQDWEGLVPQAGGCTPHLLQGLDPLLQEAVLRPKPL